VFKGHRTREQPEYSVTAASWSFLTNIPAGTHPLRYSAGYAYLATATGHLYLVKASGTNDFLVHWLSLDQWHARRPVPGKKLRHGTALVTMGKRVFCLKGGTNELAEYFAKGDSWSARSPMPRQSASGRTRKARKGACLAGDGSRYIYAFKGGWTCEFWRYDVVADTWVQLEDIPMGDCHRKVGRGGTLALLNSSLYALKAGGCLELWCYEPPAGTAGPKRLAVTGGQDAARTGLVETRGTVVILDVLGRRVKSSDRRRPGVYFALDPATGRTVKSVVVR